MAESRIATTGDTVESIPKSAAADIGWWPRLKQSARQFGRPPRLMGVDIARGLAIVGMIGAHVGKTEMLVWSDPSTWSGIINGRSAILFALLAGISIALATGGRSIPTGDALRTARLRMAGRALAILSIGLVLEMLGTPLAVILPVYGVLFLIILPFIGWSQRRLLLTAAGIALLGPVAIATVAALTFHPAGPGVSLIISGIYPLQVWLPLMLSGIAIGRSDVATPAAASRLLVIGVALAVIGYGGGARIGDLLTSDDAGSSGSSSILYDPGTMDVIPGSKIDISESVCTQFSDGWVTCEPKGGTDTLVALSATETTTWRQQFDSMGGFDTVLTTALSEQPHSGGTFEILGSGGFALAVLATCLLASRILRPVLIPIAAVGSMPLTAYAAHVISFAIIIQPFGLMAERFGGYGMISSNGFWLACVLTLLVACPLWSLTLGRGPLERVTAWAARSMNATPVSTTTIAPAEG